MGLDLKAIQQELNFNTTIRGIVTRVISKDASNLTFMGRSNIPMKLSKADVLNFDKIPVLENGNGKNEPVLIIITIKKFEEIFLKVTQAPCPTTVPFFELSSGTLKFNMI